MMKTKNTLFKLGGKVQHYQWGGYTFLPELLNISNDNQQPFAEYWLGAHENFPSELEGVNIKLLNQYISADPSVLGEKVRTRFNRLPYLFKVLDVKDMLSIQVHPSKDAAALEFEKENKAGIPLNAPHRNYKDDNHKPELMVALSDFWLLHGFKPADDIKSTIAAIPEFHFMEPLFQDNNYENLYRALMEMDQYQVNEICKPLLERIFLLYEGNALQKDSPDFWASRAALTFNEPEKVDRGIFSVYLLNLVHLKKGEAIFQDAGILHAYLEGQNMEIMANSDNVLRGGLTTKHIDVGELMKHVSFSAVQPNIIHPVKRSAFEEVYPSPASDFELSKVVTHHNEPAEIRSATADILMVMEGNVDLQEQPGNALQLRKGEAAILFSGASVEMRSSANAVVFRASVPADGE